MPQYLRDEIISLIDGVSSYMAYRKLIKTRFPEVDAVISARKCSYSESLYLFLHDMPHAPLCSCGNPLKYIDRGAGYRKFCCSACAAQDSGVISRKRESSDYVTNTKKRMDTMMARYGVEHALQKIETKAAVRAKYFAKSDDEKAIILDKRRSTIKARYGVDSMWDVPDFREKLRSTNNARFGVNWVQQNPEVLDKRTNTVRDNNYAINQRRFDNVELVTERADFTGINFYNGGSSYDWRCLGCGGVFHSKIVNGAVKPCPCCHPEMGQSKGESELIEFLRAEGIAMVLHARNIISPCEIDIFLPEHNLAIEYHGHYWHSEDKVGKSYHVDKLAACMEKNIRLVQIFEGEWHNKREIVKSRIRAMTGSAKTIFARACTVSAISAQEADLFFGETHIQGTCVSKARYGLFHDGTLVAAMTFGKSRYHRKADYELLRYANGLNIRVVGGASRLLAAFDRSYNRPSLVSYSDRRWNGGNMYLAIGMMKSHTSSPSYWYFGKDNRLYHRTHFQKHKLANLLEDYDPTETEKNNMRKHGFRRIYDCGNDVFVR